MQLQSLVGHTFEILLRIIHQLSMPKGIPPDSMLNTYYRSKKYLGSNDRKFITGNIYSTLRFYHRNKYIVCKTLDNFTAEKEEEDIIFLILLYSMENRKLSLDEYISLSRHFIKNPHLIDYIPKYFERLKNVEIPDTSIALQYSFPEWLIEKILQQYGEEETKMLCDSLNKSAPVVLRVNTLLTNVEECQKQLKQEGIESCRTILSPNGLVLQRRMNAFSLNTFRKGWFEVQDEGSQLLSYLVDPKPTYRLLDACAGAGGKTLAFASIMKNRGEIVAADVNEIRLMELRKRAKRADVHNVRSICVNDLVDLTERYEKYFDVVFVDAPCSGTGTIRRNPGLKLSLSPETVEELILKQRTILQSVAPMVKINGTLVYATCSILSEENEKNIEWFITQNSSFQKTKSPRDAIYASKLRSTDSYYYILKPHIHNTDGFFCAFLERVY